MKFSKIFKKKKKKGTQFKHPESYCLLIYKSLEGYKEIIWNGTNLSPPEYVVHRDQKFKLYYESFINERKISYTPALGERYLTYKLPEDFIKERAPVLKMYWERNHLDCQKKYSSYEEFFALSCKTMNKPRLELKVFE